MLQKKYMYRVCVRARVRVCVPARMRTRTCIHLSILRNIVIFIYMVLISLGKSCYKKCNTRVTFSQSVTFFQSQGPPDEK